MRLFTYKLRNLSITLVLVNLIFFCNFLMGVARISMEFLMVDDNGFSNCYVVALVNLCPPSFIFFRLSCKTASSNSKVVVFLA
jgi:hypothetical protein